MRKRELIMVILLLTVWGLVPMRPAEADLVVTNCSWGGTPTEPTGRVWWDAPGVRQEPSTAPTPFSASGVLEGDGCTGPSGEPLTMNFEGEYHAGSSCAAG